MAYTTITTATTVKATVKEATTKTETVTLTETTPITVRETDIGTIAVVGIAFLVVGIGIGVMAFRRH